LPTAVAIKIVQTGDVLFVRDVLIAGRAAIRIVVVRIAQVRVVVGIPAIIRVRIAVAVVVVDNASAHIGSYLGDDRLIRCRIRKRQQLSFDALAGPCGADHLSQPAQYRYDRVAIVYSDLIQTRLNEVYGAIWSRHLT
jgi:hypothetical protein